jgi:hypothetical protein
MVWLTFRNTGGRASEFVCPTTATGSSLTGSAPVFSSDAAPNARLSIAGVYWPCPQPTATIGENYWLLLKALPVTPNINRNDFQNNCFGIVWDLRRVPGDASSAISTRSGDQLTIQLTNLTANAATECTLTLFAFDVLACREAGPTLLF